MQAAPSYGSGKEVEVRIYSEYGDTLITSTEIEADPDPDRYYFSNREARKLAKDILTAYDPMYADATIAMSSFADDVNGKIIEDELDCYMAIYVVIGW